MLTTGILFFLFFIYAGITSILEKENRAAEKFITLGIFLAAPFIILPFIHFNGKEIAEWILISITLLTALLLFLPFRLYSENPAQISDFRIDERDTMFSRNKLIEGSDQYSNYYKRNPDKLEKDNGFRMEPGLLSPDSINFNPWIFSSAKASFFVVESLKPIVDGKVAAHTVHSEPEEITNYLKHWAKKLGALDIGVTETRNYHYYSYGGRDDRYDLKISQEHRYAIAFTVEMVEETTKCGPYAPIVMESAQQYLDSGVIATQLAAFIRNLGYKARAHIDGNYLVVCPLVASDAGLGEIGRMGLLMTPRQGPRVRINVVTTDLPLIPDKPSVDSSVIDFCRRCKKCADTCPSNAIPADERKNINGSVRWQIDQEACFTYWCQSGTDCGRCMSTCPYGHRTNTLHNFIRFGIKNNVLFSKLALFLDNYFYGKHPKPRPFPRWMSMSRSLNSRSTSVDQ